MQEQRHSCVASNICAHARNPPTRNSSSRKNPIGLEGIKTFTRVNTEIQIRYINIHTKTSTDLYLYLRTGFYMHKSLWLGSRTLSEAYPLYHRSVHQHQPATRPLGLGQPLLSKKIPTRQWGHGRGKGGQNRRSDIQTANRDRPRMCTFCRI